MSNKYKTASLFGMAHGLNDFIAGYLLANLSLHSSDIFTNSLAYLMYSVIAFGGQLPAGIIVDKYKRLKPIASICLLLLILSISVSYASLFMAIFFSAIASAFIHVCGAAACYVSDNKHYTLAGIFTSPGVIGLICGGILGSIDFNYFYLFILPLVVLLLWLMYVEIPSYENKKVNAHSSDTILDTHDMVMLLLLMTIAVRSLFWNVVHMMSFNQQTWLLVLGFSAGAGKLLGAIIADRVGWKKFMYVSIIGAVICLNIDKSNIILFGIGVFFLQSAVPITLVLVQQYMKQSPATAAGLCLGVLILFAGLPSYFHAFRQLQTHQHINVVLSALFFLSNFCFLLMYQRKAKYQ